MKGSFFRSMTWLHTWVGLLVCWLVFLIFFAGTISFYRDEVTFWAQPEIHHVAAQPTRIPQQKEQILSSIKALQSKAPNSTQWRVNLPDERNNLLSYGYAKPIEKGKRRASFKTTYIDPISNSTVNAPRETKGGNFFYRLHFDLHYIDTITARWIVCLASLFMLIALISGIVIHKRIFKDMFNFRRNKGCRSWLDSHTITSVIALPFHLMITYTGLITFIFMLFPYPANHVYDNGLKGLFDDVYPTNVRSQPTDVQAKMLPVSDILDHVYTKSNNIDITRLTIRNPNTSSATVAVYLSTQTKVQEIKPVFLFNAIDGSLLAKSGMELSNSEVFYDSMTALHSARLAKPLLRWLYFLCGIAGCIMIASGCILWAKRIRERLKNDENPSFGLKLVEGLNLATLMGLPFATSAFFIANRLLPVTTLAREDKEILAFFLAWLSVALFALFKRQKHHWRVLAWVNCIACFSVPLVNALTTDGNIISYLINAQWSLFSIDLVWVICAVLFAIQTKKLRTHANEATSRIHQGDISPATLKAQRK